MRSDAEMQPIVRKSGGSDRMSSGDPRSASTTCAGEVVGPVQLSQLCRHVQTSHSGPRSRVVAPELPIFAPNAQQLVHRVEFHRVVAVF